MTNKRKSSHQDLTETTESRAAFSRRLQIDAGYLTRLIHKGLPITENGDLVRVEAAIAWMRANIGKPGRQPGSVHGDNGTPASEDLLQARIRLVLAQAERAEYELEVSKENHVPKPEAVKAIRALARIYRDHMLNFASRYGQEIAAEFQIPAGAFIGVLDARIRDALLQAAETPMPYEADKCICENCTTEG